MKEIKSAGCILKDTMEEYGSPRLPFDVMEAAMRTYASQFIDKAAEVAEDKRWVVTSSPPQQAGENSKIVKEILSLHKLLK